MTAILVLVVNAKPNNSRGYDGPVLRDHVDYLHVMTYDFHGPWSNAGHHTPLFSNKADAVSTKYLSFPAALSFWSGEQGFRKEQILFGWAGYGRGFKVQNWFEKPTAPSQYPEIDFKDIRALVGNVWTRQWDQEAQAPWLLSDDKSDRISYDDEQSARAKAHWMRENGLAGFMIWEISEELVNGKYLLSEAAAQAWTTPPAKK